jgi:predicted site-specific integrase-resolvase
MSYSLLKAKDAAEYYKLSISNLRKLAREGKIESITTAGGHYRYVIKNDDEEEDKQDREISENIIYARVSSKKQQNGLQRQIIKLQRAFPGFTIITDIGSGINFQRKGFKSIMEFLFQGKVRKVVVANQDRFSRFGFNFFQWMFQQFNATLESINPAKINSNEELADDLMEIITVFSSRYYGRRSHKNDNKED